MKRKWVFLFTPRELNRDDKERVFFLPILSGLQYLHCPSALSDLHSHVPRNDKTLIVSQTVHLFSIVHTHCASFFPFSFIVFAAFSFRRSETWYTRRCRHFSKIFVERELNTTCENELERHYDLNLPETLNLYHEMFGVRNEATFRT